MNFKAQCVTFENDGESHTVGFADNGADPQTYVILQRAVESTEEEVRFGLDQIYITIDDQLRSTYGGVLDISVSSDVVVIRVSSEAAKELKMDGDIIIDIDVAAPPMREVKESLEALAKGECPVRWID